jgi:hypothetical protein
MTDWFERWYWATLFFYALPLLVALVQLGLAHRRQQADFVDVLIWLGYVIFVPFGWLMWFWRSSRTGYRLERSPHHVSDPPTLEAPGRRRWRDAI